MRTLLALLIAAAAAVASDRVTFRLPDATGKPCGIEDFKSRYLLLVYQGIP